MRGSEKDGDKKRERERKKKERERERKRGEEWKMDGEKGRGNRGENFVL